MILMKDHWKELGPLIVSLMQEYASHVNPDDLQAVLVKDAGKTFCFALFRIRSSLCQCFRCYSNKVPFSAFQCIALWAGLLTTCMTSLISINGSRRHC